MNAVEFVVEHVVTGLLVLCVFALALAPGLTGEGVNDFVAGSAVVTAAYLVGVLFDRFADTLLSRQEQTLRLAHAVKLARASRDPLRDDPFPEDTIQVRVPRASDGLAEWLAFLRTRIRVVRSLAIFLPAISLAAALREVVGGPLEPVALAGVVVVSLIYAITFRRVLERKVPRTDEFDASKEYPVSWVGEPIVHGAFQLGVVGVVLFGAAAYMNRGQPLLIAAVLFSGFALSALAFWTWRRILKTQFEFLSAADRVLKQENAGDGTANASKG